jgi:hypothetical protein
MQRPYLLVHKLNENTSRFSLYPELQLDQLTQIMDPPEDEKKTNIMKHIKTNQIEFFLIPVYISKVFSTQGCFQI